MTQHQTLALLELINRFGTNNRLLGMAKAEGEHEEADIYRRIKNKQFQQIFDLISNAQQGE